MTKVKKQDSSSKEFEGFKTKLGKYIQNTRPPGKTKLEAAAELDTSLSKYNAYEDPNNEYGRQSIPLDLLFQLAKRDRMSLTELIDKIDSQDLKNQTTKFEKSTKDKIIQKILDKISRTSRSEEIFELYNLFHEVKSEFPKDDPINSDSEIWVIYMLKNILLLGKEDIVELIYTMIKKVSQRQKMKEIDKNIDLSFNNTFMQHAINQFIQQKKKEFIDQKVQS